MEIILLLSSLTSLTIFGLILFFLIKEIKTQCFQYKEIPLIVLALTYLILAISLILWSINFFPFENSDLLSVFSLILVAQTLCLLTIQKKIKPDKKIIYYTSPLLLIIPILIFIPNLLHIMIPISLFITMITFLSETSLHETPTRYLIAYTSISLFLYLFQTLWPFLTKTFCLLSTVLFLLFIIPLLKFLSLHKPENMWTSPLPESPLINFLKHFVFIIIITNFIFIGTISVHEFGHLMASSHSDCEEAKIVYELSGLPHTQISCENKSDQNLWALGGILLPIILAIALFFSGGKFIKEISLQIIGFSLIISYLDLKFLGFSSALSIFVLISGIALTVFSLALLVKTRVE